MRADYKKGGSVKSPAWQRKEGKNPKIFIFSFFNIFRDIFYITNSKKHI